MRIEQLFPLSFTALAATIDELPAGQEVVWVQEEPENMGPLSYVRLKFAEQLAERWSFHRVSRAESSSPATGSAARHRTEQQNLVSRAFGALGTKRGK